MKSKMKHIFSINASVIKGKGYNHNSSTAVEPVKSASTSVIKPSDLFFIDNIPDILAQYKFICYNLNI